MNKRALRRRMLATPLTDNQRAIVAEYVPLTNGLPADMRSSFEGKINLLLSQVTFHGCDGFEVTEEVELAIAAQACLLIVNTDQWYKHLRTILIYPGAFRSRKISRDGYLATESQTVRLGESWSRGPVILSWEASDQGAANEKDGRNVVLHEFAHQLDDQSGQTNGVPILNKKQTFSRWEDVIMKAYARHVAAVEHNKKTVIDPYGAEGYEEFFAVAIEVFFERPSTLRDNEPEVYDELSTLLQLDPRKWETT